MTSTGALSVAENRADKTQSRQVKYVRPRLNVPAQYNAEAISISSRNVSVPDGVPAPSDHLAGLHQRHALRQRPAHSRLFEPVVTLT